MCESLTSYTHLELDTQTAYVCVVHNNTCWCGGKVRAVVCVFVHNIHRAASPRRHFQPSGGEGDGDGVATRRRRHPVAVASHHGPG